MERVKLDSDALKAIDDYAEYRRIVGEDDKGVLFTPEEYEKYKKEVVPRRVENRLFVSWTSPSGMDCKLIGPQTQCLCQHRYIEHQTDLEPSKLASRKLPCLVGRCPCNSFTYLPANGSQQIRCHCKHFANDHNVNSFQCLKIKCSCKKFTTSLACPCGDKIGDHRMIVETKQERKARGMPVGLDVPYKAMGGLTGFSSLAEGYMRLDPSGIGYPTNLESSGDCHPFLKQFDVGDVRREGESELDYYERMYQKKLKNRKYVRK